MRQAASLHALCAARRIAALAALAPGLACGGGSELVPLEATVADCGGSLQSALDLGSESSPPLDASYSDALAAWRYPDGSIGLGAYQGQCADGKRLLYRNSGFVSEVRYYDGERLVGYVSSGDVGVCPSVCPFSRFYGPVEGVRCEAPSATPIDASSRPLAEPLRLPFANGQPPGGCQL